MATALPGWMVTAIIKSGLRLYVTRRVAKCGGDCEQWRYNSKCEDETRMILHVSIGLRPRGDSAVVLQPAKDLRKNAVDKSLPYLPGDGPSLPMDVHTKRFVNIARMSYRNAETVYTCTGQ
jgi:hypothetical protein